MRRLLEMRLAQTSQQYCISQCPDALPAACAHRLHWGENNVFPYPVRTRLGVREIEKKPGFFSLIVPTHPAREFTAPSAPACQVGDTTLSAEAMRLVVTAMLGKKLARN